MELSVEQIKELCKVVAELKLDFLKVGDVVIKKSSHQLKEETQPFSKPKLSLEQQMYAAGAPPLTEEESLMVLRPKRRKTEE